MQLGILPELTSSQVDITVVPPRNPTIGTFMNSPYYGEDGVSGTQQVSCDETSCSIHAVSPWRSLEARIAFSSSFGPLPSLTQNAWVEARPPLFVARGLAPAAPSRRTRPAGSALSCRAAVAFTSTAAMAAVPVRTLFFRFRFPLTTLGFEPLAFVCRGPQPPNHQFKPPLEGN